MTNRKVEAHVSLARSSNGEWRLEVTDNTSNVLITELILDAEAFSDLMSTRQQVVPGIIASERDVRFLGKEFETRRENFAKEADADERMEQLSLHTNLRVWKRKTRLGNEILIHEYKEMN